MPFDDLVQSIRLCIDYSVEGRRFVGVRVFPDKFLGHASTEGWRYHGRDIRPPRCSVEVKRAHSASWLKRGSCSILLCLKAVDDAD